jgi:hypothetical protein
MRRQRIDSGLEKQFIIGMILCDEFLSSARAILDIDLLASSHLRQIAQWCFDHQDTYGKAPKQSIEAVYFAWLEKGDKSQAEVDAIYGILNELSGQAGEFNVAYLEDQLRSYLTGRRLHRLRNDLEDQLSRGEVEKALREVQSFSSPELGSEVGVDPLNEEVWEKVFAEHEESLLTFPGDAGRFLNPACTRDALIGIQAPEKRGKTFWALEFVLRALQGRRKVALFEAGDLSEGQILRRLAVRITGLPLWPQQCGEIQVPRRIVLGEGLPTVETRGKECPRTVAHNDCAKSIKKFLRGCGIPLGSPYLLVSTHPTSTLSVRDIEAILDGWEVKRGFIPDVIVVDYADILAPEDSKTQGRDRTNETWQALRRLSQQRRCLVVAPTQADADSYERHTQGMKNFSEDKRKLAHVTGLFGLNQTEDEKAASLMRLNWIVLREAPFESRRCLYIAQCLPLGRVLCCSRLDNNTTAGRTTNVSDS